MTGWLISMLYCSLQDLTPLDRYLPANWEGWKHITKEWNGLRAIPRGMRNDTIVLPKEYTNDFDMNTLCTPEHFRFIDCSAYVLSQEIRIVECLTPREGSSNLGTESEVLKKIPYIAISYPWRGIKPNAPPRLSFDVVLGKDQVPGDRVSLDVFHIICKTCMSLGVRYMWLDRLCIIQNSKDDRDKSWQIANMADVYSNCRLCLVAIGGLQAFAPHDEGTDWIYRSWTLQEAVLPPKTYCLFRWDRGDGELLLDGPDEGPQVWQVEAGVACTSLEALLKACTARYEKHGPKDTNIAFRPSKIHDASDFPMRYNPRPAPMQNLPELKIFSESIEPLYSLLAVINGRRDYENLPEGKYKERALIDKEVAIWRCAMMRTSSSEKDVVFSIMGFFGVKLKPKDFKGKKKMDVIIALCRAVLEQRNGQANWFVATTLIPSFSPKFCGLPYLPSGTNAKTPMVEIGNRKRSKINILQDLLACNNERIKEVIPCHDLLQGHRLSLDNPPKGIVNSDGSVHIQAKMSRFKIRGPRGEDGFQEERDVFEAYGLPNTRASANRNLSIRMRGEAGTHAVLLGTLRPYEHLSRDGGTTLGLVMLVKEGRHNSWRQTGVAVIRIGSTNGWELRHIHLGGEHAGKTNYLANFTALFASFRGY
jgi:hypothetical protein